MRGGERDAVPGSEVVDLVRRRAHPQRQDDRSVDGDHGHRFVRQEAPVADRTHPPLLHRDVRPLVERLGRVQIGERDRGVDAGVRRERLHHRPSEVLAGFQHPRPEGVGAVAVGGEVPHPVVVLAHEVDRRPGPRVARVRRRSSGGRWPWPRWSSAPPPAAVGSPVPASPTVGSTWVGVVPTAFAVGTRTSSPESRETPSVAMMASVFTRRRSRVPPRCMQGESAIRRESLSRVRWGRIAPTLAAGPAAAQGEPPYAP